MSVPRPSSPRPWWLTAAGRLGAVLLVAALGLAAAPVAADHGSCGTGLAPSAPDDMVVGPACDDAQAQRRALVAVTGLPGLLLLGAAGAGAAGRRRRAG